MRLEAAAHAALGDVKRLAIIDGLAAGDHTVSELADRVGIRGNLLAHHLDVLETAGLIDRRVSEGDHRRRYVSLRWECLPSTPARPPPTTGVVFVCTANSARSPFAAGLWEQRTGHRAASAGNHPAAAVHPRAVEVAAEFGVDLSAAKPAGYDLLTETPALVISVCDRARESGPPPGDSACTGRSLTRCLPGASDRFDPRSATSPTGSTVSPANRPIAHRPLGILPRRRSQSMPVTLTTGEQLQIRQAAVRLKGEFEGQLNTETIERFMTDSLDTLIQNASTSQWIPLLAERFARDRLRALIRLDADPATLKPSVLFLCVHNAGRSQMAAGWMRHLAGDQVDVFSGGSEPADRINQAAVAAMAEVGIDISRRFPNPGRTRSSAPPTSSSPWDAATPAPYSPVSATSTGNSTTPPTNPSTRCDPSETTSNNESATSSPNSGPRRQSELTATGWLQTRGDRLRALRVSAHASISSERSGSAAIALG